MVLKMQLYGLEKSNLRCILYRNKVLLSKNKEKINFKLE